MDLKVLPITVVTISPDPTTAPVKMDKAGEILCSIYQNGCKIESYLEEFLEYSDLCVKGSAVDGLILECVRPTLHLVNATRKSQHPSTEAVPETLSPELLAPPWSPELPAPPWWLPIPPETARLQPPGRPPSRSLGFLLLPSCPPQLDCLCTA
ncbi:hypothetical protein PO909_004794 [Leuciscus waleckii]